MSLPEHKQGRDHTCVRVCMCVCGLLSEYQLYSSVFFSIETHTEEGLRLFSVHINSTNLWMLAVP